MACSLLVSALLLRTLLPAGGPVNDGAQLEPLYSGVVYHGDLDGTGPGDVLAGDLDGDGHLDVVASHGGAFEGSLRAFLGAGDGTLRQSWKLRTALVASIEHGPGIALADLDEDGHLDLAATTYDPAWSISWLPGDGKGGFLDPVPVPVRGIPQLLRAGDVNGDGHADLVVGILRAGSSQGPAVWVLLGDGQGGFAPGRATNLGGAPLGLVDLELGDVDGDGLPDLFVALRNGPTGYALNVGGGRFAVPRRLLDGETVRSMAVGDLDGDGDLDVAVGVDGRIQLLGGDGAGRLEPRGVVALLGGERPWRLDTVRLGLDKVPGLLVQQQAGGNLQETYGLVRIGPDLAGGRVRVHATGEMTAVLTAADLDEDGVVDVVMRSGAGWMAPAGAVFLGGADGGQRGVVSTLLLPGPGAGLPHHALLLLEDLGGDGVPDAVVLTDDRRLDIHPGTREGTFGDPVSYPMPAGTGVWEGSSTVALGDVDGDSLPDLILASADLQGTTPPFFLGPLRLTILRNLGGGAFAQEPTVHVARREASLFEVLCADVDGDGADEIATLQSVDGRLRVLDRSPAGGWSVQASAPVSPGGRPFGARDVDGDGREEVLLLLDGSSTLRALWAVDWTPASGLGPAVELIGLPRLETKLVLADVDADGLLDAFVGEASSYGYLDGSLTLWKGRPGGGFDLADSARTFGLPLPFGPRDLDGDGRAELVARVQGYVSGHLGVWDVGPGPALRSRGDYVGHWQGMELGDLDGDGFEDLVFVWHDRLYTSFNLASGKH